MFRHRLSAGVVLALALAAGFPLAGAAMAQAMDPPGEDATALAPLPDDPGFAPAPSSQLLNDDVASIAIAPAGHRPSGVARELAQWVAASQDNSALPYMIIDKLGARVFAFDAAGDFLGSAPVLVGLARGDDSAPGVGDLKLAAISPDERTTPAGRFVARFGDSDGHGTVLWVDYADAISLHPVMSVNAGERRQQRIRSADPGEHRISYGCINVPARFYADVVQTSFEAEGGVVYILPDTKPLAAIFPAFAAETGAAEDQQLSREAARCAGADVPDRVPEPDPGDLCPVDDRLTATR
jgi:hypothetical protein